ncbi:MAG: MFS transporter [Elusimicrobiota bacterium]
MKASLRALLLGMACMAVSSFFDNSRGPLLPLLAERYGLDHSRTALFVSAGSLAAFFLFLLSMRLLRRMTLTAYLRTAMALLVCAVAGTAAGGGFGALLICGLLWGGSVAALNMSTNLLAVEGADESARFRRLGMTHACYGLGSAAAGFYAAYAVSSGWNLERILFSTLPLIACLFIGAGGPPAAPKQKEAAGGLPWRQLLSLKAVSGNLALSFYVLGEVLASMWLTTFLVAEGGVSLPRASLYLTGFFIALSAGRAAGAWLISPAFEKRLAPLCLVVGTAGFLAGMRGIHGGFLLGAFALGPFFPLTVSSFMRDYREMFPSLLALCYSTLTLALILGHLAIGALSDVFSLGAAFYLPAACLVVSLALFCLSARQPSPAA